ncbi:MAG TPA: acyl-phosphate glycerol 3-phosphate acyltransferase [Synergistaceae bacterium]|jgi:glycerol-3-phosphate acyltransferase PlsY|nr:acyl-phosphate glycerol 3-phosphate acyltransferase [Synergistaceae bacterium]
MSILWLIFGYLAGSCPTGYLAVKILKGQDVRDFGSGNIGATNTGRVLGKKWAIAVAVFDMLKGGIAVLLASFFTESSIILALTGVSSVLGHNYPVWLGWKGGKGVATTFGVFAFFDFFNPLPALIGGAVWYSVLRMTKYVCVASITALFTSVLLMPLFGMPRPYYLAGLFLAALSTWRHKGNIKRLIEGTEDKAGEHN